MMNMPFRVLVPAALALAASVAAAQPARQAYKHVDEQGRVTYSQSPPTGDAKKVDIPPPRKSVPYSQRDTEREAIRRQEYENRRQRAEHERQAQREALEESRRKQIEALRAECNRNRGTDCNDPETIRRMEADRGPSRYRPTATRH